jgi:hypothetical protein
MDKIMSNATEALRKSNALFEAMPLIRKFVGQAQIGALAEAINGVGAGLGGEEREHFIDMMLELAEHVRTMHKTYEQDGQGGNAIVGLHYFRGGMDWFITERDMEDEQNQAFGYADLGYGGELGYISIQELIDNDVELDLYWTPKTLDEVKANG